jgi:hypothetical protein
MTESQPDSDKTPDGKKVEDGLPFPNWWPVVAGALMGIALRVVFSGQPNTAYAAMSASFIYFAPGIVGAVTVYMAERRKRRSWNYYMGASIVANLLFVAGTMLIMIEGLICAIVIAPLFCLLGAIGGLLMGLICRLTNWRRKALYSVGVLPLLLGPVEADMPIPERVGTVERALVIDAAPAEVWRRILNVPEIKPEEIERAWMFRIGVPLTKSGALRESSGERVRRVTMGKNIYFDEVVTDWDENRYLRWTYRYYEASFPRYALDEHVVLGGHYFDIKDTSYTLIPRGAQTEVRLRMTYRVSTRFNWYADPVARLLLENLAQTNLDYYRGRSEPARP